MTDKDDAALAAWDAETNPIEGPSEISMTGTIHARDALAARLREVIAERDNAIAERVSVVERWNDDAMRLRYERDTWYRMNADSEQKRADAMVMLARIRAIAENYHDVDVTGDPPREVNCNPCAAEVLAVLDGGDHA